jgi:hypothetical protein
VIYTSNSSKFFCERDSCKLLAFAANGNPTIVDLNLQKHNKEIVINKYLLLTEVAEGSAGDTVQSELQNSMNGIGIE